MPDTVTVKTLSGLSTDGYGTPTWSTGVSYSARKVYEQKLVRTFEGTEEVSNTTLWIASTSTMSPAAHYALPNGETPGNLMAIETFSDENGITHSKVYFG